MRTTNVKKYDISFLLPYLEKRNIDIVFLARKIDMSEKGLKNLLLGKKKIYLNDLEKLLDFFNCETLEELRIVIEADINKMKVKKEMLNLNSRYDISFLSKYLENKNMSIERFSFYTGINQNKLEKWILEGTLVEEEDLKSVLAYFSVDSYAKLVSKFEKRVKNDENEKFKQFLLKMEISKSNLADNLGISRQYVDMILNSKRRISPKYYSKMKEYLNVKEDYDFESYIEFKEELKVFSKTIIDNLSNYELSPEEIRLIYLFSKLESCSIKKIVNVSNTSEEEVITLYNKLFEMHSKMKKSLSLQSE